MSRGRTTGRLNIRVKTGHKDQTRPLSIRTALERALFRYFPAHTKAAKARFSCGRSILSRKVVRGAKPRALLNHWQRVEIHGGLCARLIVVGSIDIGKRLALKQKHELDQNLVFPNPYNRI